jgi:hypothetical protein
MSKRKPTELLQAHPLADLFPLLEGEAFEELVDDIIQARGVREPIVLHDGKILDGRNRYRAAAVAGVACPMRTYDGDDPLAYVISLNLHRRHLSESQRAMVAAKLATLRVGDNQHSEGLPIGRSSELLNVSARSVARAKLVREEGGPELVDAVERGELSVSAAEDIARRGIVTGLAMHPYAERGLDLYETPETATRALLEVEKLPKLLWEPACGPGAIVRVLRGAGHRVIASDIEAEAYGCPDAQGGVNFLDLTRAPKGVDTIVTNPPFMFADEFVRTALTLVPRVIMLLRFLFLETEGRNDIIDGGRLQRVHLFRNRLMIHRHSWTGPRISGSAVALAWFVWDARHNGLPTLHRISWRKDGDEAPYDASADLAGSLDDCYAAVRERVAAGGPKWEP